MKVLLLALVCALGTAAPAAAQLAKVETADLRVVYVKGSESFIAPYAARTFLNSIAFDKTLFDYRPTHRTTLLLVDFQDHGNASATSTPRNTVRVQIAPLSYLFETITANERFFMIANHELIHVTMMDQAAGRDRAFRRLFFGKVTPIAEQPESILYFYLTTPRVAAPRWFHEGAATFVETWMDGGIGRAQGGYDEMVFRSMVRDNAHFYDPLGLAAEGTKIDFQVEVNSYLYGTRFMTWLAYRYTPKQIVQWTSRHNGSHAYYAGQFRQVFGTPLESAWNEWIGFEKTFQQQNLAAIRKYPITPSTDLSPRALGSISRAYYDEPAGRIYAGLDYQGAVAHIAAISTKTGAVQRLVDIKGPRVFEVASLAWDPKGATMFYTADNSARRDLMRLDLKTNRTRMLQKDLRVGDLAMNRADQSLWGIRHLNGLCSIVRIVPPYTQWARLVTLPFGTVVYDLDVSPDGTMAVVGWGEVSGRQSVRIMSTAALLAGNTTTIAEFDFGGSAVPTGFVFSPDGRYVYGSSYYTGASNIFRYEIATKQLEAVTNAETGFFRPVPLGNDELIVFRYTGQGFVPARLTAKPLQDVSAITFLGQQLVEKHPVLKTWQVGSPNDVPYDTMPKTEGAYHLTGGLETESIFPIVQGYKDTAAAGVRLNFSDPLQFNRAMVSASWSPGGGLAARERAHVRAEYQRYDWTALGSWNDADFYDLFGPTKVSRKGYSVSLGHTKTLIYDQPRKLQLIVQGRFAGSLDQLPEYQNVAVTVDKLFSIKADLTYHNERGSLGNVDMEKGQAWSLDLRSDYVNSTAFARLYATHDIGRPLPIAHSSVWVRSAAGFSPQSRTEPFANFYFGGFGNNYVDHAEEQRYRQYHSLPGTALNAIGGRNFVKSMIEWNAPPLRFSRAGTPGAYISWMRPTLFVGGLVTNFDSLPDRQRAVTAGGQLDFRFTTLSVLDMTLSVGAAVARQPGQAAHGEAMISLKVLR
jgi:hypothetical protein